MDQFHPIPLLFTFYFGTSAPSALHSAGKRLKQWSWAFDAWMVNIKTRHQPDTAKHAVLAWRRLAGQSCRMPWQLTPKDIDRHLRWMEEQGFARSTVNASLGFIAGFYRWCTEHHPDSACPPAFNPALPVLRARRMPYEGAVCWSTAEVSSFLDLLKRDETPLGRRDYAFFLLRLHSGVPLKKLRSLEWSQLEPREGAVWLKWRPSAEPLLLSAQVWSAISGFLRVSGRLEGMCPGRFVFAPLALPSLESPRTNASDWLELQPLSNSAILSNLKLYGRQVGIPERKLNLITLRRTAIRMRLDQGDSLEAMQAFMNTTEKIKQTKYRLRRLQGLSAESALTAENRAGDAALPVRSVKNFVPLEKTTGAFPSLTIDPAEFKAVILEDIHGLDQEIACLRILMRGLLDRLGDGARLLDAYTCLTRRLQTVLALDQASQTDPKRQEREQWLVDFNAFLTRHGYSPVGSSPGQAAIWASEVGIQDAGMLLEEVTTSRLLLRKVYATAMSGVDTSEYLKLANRYSLGCVRLAKMLQFEGCDEIELLQKKTRALVDVAIREVNQELRSGDPIGDDTEIDR